MKVRSLFTGIGGFDRAAELAGMTVIQQCEIDKNCQMVLRHHWPDVAIHDDVTTLGATATKKYNYRLTEKQKIHAVEMYEAGLSCQQVADYYDVTRQSMWDVLHRRTKMRSNLKLGEENHFWRGGATADDHAQNILETAVKQGTILRVSVCEQCGASGTMNDGRALVQAHHPDYNKPLTVMWLCQPCHHLWHTNNRAIAREGGDANGSQLEYADLLCGGFP